MSDVRPGADPGAVPTPEVQVTGSPSAPLATAGPVAPAEPVTPASEVVAEPPTVAGPLVTHDLPVEPEGLPSPDRGRRAVAVVVLVVVVAAVVGAIASSWTDLKQVQQTFFNWTFLKDSFPTVLKGFWLNVKLFMVAEALVLVWALVVALVRSLPGRAAAPARALAIVYVDVFRGLPAIVTIYLVGFGLPLSGLPIVSQMSLFQLGVLALTLVYGAYVAEVYRAGIESVHWSQSAAARSLGLTHRQTMRFVVVPQAVRRVIPPLLNDFIGLQKDTALVSVIGLLEGFNRARIYSGNKFNLSPMVGLGLCFVVITIPMARLTDHLLKRDQRRMRVG